MKNESEETNNWKDHDGASFCPVFPLVTLSEPVMSWSHGANNRRINKYPGTEFEK